MHVGEKTESLYIAKKKKKFNLAEKKKEDLVAFVQWVSFKEGKYFLKRRLHSSFGVQLIRST